MFGCVAFIHSLEVWNLLGTSWLFDLLFVPFLVIFELKKVIVVTSPQSCKYYVIVNVTFFESTSFFSLGDYPLSFTSD